MKVIVKSCIVLGLFGLALLAFVAMTGTAKADLILTYDFTAFENGTNGAVTGSGYFTYDASMLPSGGGLPTNPSNSYYPSGSQPAVHAVFTPSQVIAGPPTYLTTPLNDSDSDNHVTVLHLPAVQDQVSLLDGDNGWSIIFLDATGTKLTSSALPQSISALVGWPSAQLTYMMSDNQNHTFTITNVTPDVGVPEPSGLVALLGLGAIGLGYRTWRRRKQAA